MSDTTDDMEYWSGMIDTRAPKKYRKIYIWTTKDGKEIEIQNMTTEHIKNTVAYLIRKKDDSGWIEILEKELLIRGLIK